MLFFFILDVSLNVDVVCIIQGYKVEPCEIPLCSLIVEQLLFTQWLTFVACSTSDMSNMKFTNMRILLAMHQIYKTCKIIRIYNIHAEFRVSAICACEHGFKSLQCVECQFKYNKY